LAHGVLSMNKHERGFTLVEVLVAILLIGLALLAVAPMFVYAVRSTASSADLGSAGAKAIERMEQLRSKSFASLAAGGSLSSNVTNYFDASDPRFVVRWTVANNATPPTKKTITVRAQAVRQVVGLRKEAQVTTVRAK